MYKYIVKGRDLKLEHIICYQVPAVQMYLVTLSNNIHCMDTFVKMAQSAIGKNNLY